MGLPNCFREYGLNDVGIGGVKGLRVCPDRRKKKTGDIFEIDR